MIAADIDERRKHVHGMWAAVAPRWADYADEIDERGAAMTERLLDLLGLLPGQRVLELACGPGGAGLAAAAAVGDRGQVLISDVAAEMVATAMARAKARGLSNVVAATLDLEDIDQPESTFDSVVCREGLMFAVDPARALGEIHRVLRAGGRLAFSVWGPPDANPWLGVVVDAVAAVTGKEIPPPGMPGPFALADRSVLLPLVERAGFESVTLEGLEVPLRSPSFDAWWRRTAVVAGPVATIIARLDASTRTALEDHLRAAVAEYATDRGVELPGLALIGYGRRPEA
ncbi:MAG TPA: class I SAM-dependent methyltransferase [Egibacteraceae bacterium]|jgi:ubiquinone/menaquinone biosynthesis C-methylase UbiE|nr:class I SAM-dependent methyltransferase [Egibacteraceae bacterium]